MDLNPARRACHVLAMVLGSPALDKAHADRTHLGKFIHSLEAVIDRLTEKLGELLVVKNL